MGFWTNKLHRSAFDDAEVLGYEPVGGPLKMWLAGVLLALIPLVYGLYCLRTGQAIFFGKNGHLDLTGPAATSMAIAYMSVGGFIHFHYFWGLHPKLLGLSQLLKLVTVIVFLCSFIYTIYKVLA